MHDCVRCAFSQWWFWEPNGRKIIFWQWQTGLKISDNLQVYNYFVHWAKWKPTVRSLLSDSAEASGGQIVLSTRAREGSACLWDGWRRERRLTQQQERDRARHASRSPVGREAQWLLQTFTHFRFALNYVTNTAHPLFFFPLPPPFINGHCCSQPIGQSTRHESHAAVSCILLLL